MADKSPEPTFPLQIPYAQIDAFTDKAFSGNAAAVCLLPCPPSREWMLALAGELRQSETAFLVKLPTGHTPTTSSGEIEDSLEEFDIWWFTPEAEEDLCGHATLASAHFLFTNGYLQGNSVTFYNKGRTLKATKLQSEVATTGSEQGRTIIELDFPLSEPEEVKGAEVAYLSDALGGVEVIWAGKSRLDYLVEVPSLEDVSAIVPDKEKLMKIEARGVIPTAKLGVEYLRDPKFRGVDFVSRFLATDNTGEDPVTGSAHCTSGPYWAKRLGKSSLGAYQLSRRGGHLRVRVDKENERVFLQGTAVTVIQGVLNGSFFSAAA